MTITPGAMAQGSFAMEGITFGLDMLNVPYAGVSDLLGLFTRPAVALGHVGLLPAAMSSALNEGGILIGLIGMASAGVLAMALEKQQA